MPKIFCCYRRDDSTHQAGRIFDHLTARFGNDQLFRDVDSMPLGLDFRRVVSEQVAACQVLLAIIGDGWLNASEPKGGGRRLDDPGDLVRIEIESALLRNIPVIPVLVGHTQVPQPGDLPESLRELAFRHGLAVRADPDFHHDVERLIRGIDQALKVLAAAAPRKQWTQRIWRAHPIPPEKLPNAMSPAARGRLRGSDSDVPSDTVIESQAPSAATASGAAPPKPRRGLRWIAAALGLLGIGTLRALLAIRNQPPTMQPSIEVGKEQVRSPEWTAWRQQIEEKLSVAILNEETLAQALRLKRPEVRTSPAAALRGDQAVADVLQSYAPVRSILKSRLGITDQFLGTGFSNPVNSQDYESVTLHEYLIPNLSDRDRRIWMRKIKLTNLGNYVDKTIKEFIKDNAEEDAAAAAFKQKFISFAEAGERERVMVRFAIFDERFYQGELGLHMRERVFASDLAEVWKLKVVDAASRSGYRLIDGDTFFIWVFLPIQKQEAVLATWGQVLNHLPEWMEKAQNRGS
jgi:hypothetical protein